MTLMLLSLRAPEPLNTDNRFVPEPLSVLDPVGFPPAASSPTLAPRLEALKGKTVFIIDCQMENSGVLLEQMQAWFRENLPGVRTPLVRWRGEIYEGARRPSSSSSSGRELRRRISLRARRSAGPERTADLRRYGR
jgi:hypothetical protein